MESVPRPVHLCDKHETCIKKISHGSFVINIYNKHHDGPCYTFNLNKPKGSTPIINILGSNQVDDCDIVLTWDSHHIKAKLSNDKHNGYYYVNVL